MKRSLLTRTSREHSHNKIVNFETTKYQKMLSSIFIRTIITIKLKYRESTLLETGKPHPTSPHDKPLDTIYSPNKLAKLVVQLQHKHKYAETNCLATDAINSGAYKHTYICMHAPTSIRSDREPIIKPTPIHYPLPRTITVETLHYGWGIWYAKNFAY